MAEASFPERDGGLGHTDDLSHVIVFENIDLLVSIGVYASEKIAPQRVRVSAEILVRPAAARADRIEGVVDYDRIHRAILALAERGHVELQETFAEEVARICLEPGDVAAVRVYVRKLDVYPDCESVGIRMVRTRPVPESRGAR